MKLQLRRCFAVAAMFVISAGAWAQPAPQVKTAAGTVEGKDDGAVRSFLGIPYAAPPVGDMRWKAPVPAGKWDGVRKATEFGSHCLQGNLYGDMVISRRRRQRRLSLAKRLGAVEASARNCR